VAVESNTIRIGDIAHSRTFLAGVRGRTTGTANAVAVVIDSNGKLGTLNSSERFKTDIQDMNEGSLRLLELRPVTYRYKQDSEVGNDTVEYGLIAEEIDKVYPDLVAHDHDGSIETVRYHKLTPMLLNEVKRLDVLLREQADKNRALEQEVVALKQQMEVVQTQAQLNEALTARLSRLENRGELAAR
jgi:predicted ribosome quality control (RQC) complex YloA/Tae2 family protein